eukprot:gene11553-4804_t
MEQELKQFEEFFYMPKEFPKLIKGFSEAENNVQNVSRFQINFFTNKLELTTELYEEKLKILNEEQSIESILIFYQLGLLFFYVQKDKLIPKVFEELENHNCYESMPKSLKQMIEIHHKLYNIQEEKIITNISLDLRFNNKECQKSVECYFYYYMSKIKLRLGDLSSADEHIKLIKNNEIQDFSDYLFYRQKIIIDGLRKVSNDSFEKVDQFLGTYRCLPLISYFLQIKFTNMLTKQEYQQILDYTNQEKKGTYNYKIIQIYKLIVLYGLNNGDKRTIEEELKEVDSFKYENLVFKTLYEENITDNKKNPTNQAFLKLQNTKDLNSFKNESAECLKVFASEFKNAQNDFAWKKFLHIYCYCGLRWWEQYNDKDAASNYLLPFQTENIKFFVAFHIYNDGLICITKKEDQIDIRLSRKIEVLKKIELLSELFHGENKQQNVDIEETGSTLTKDELIDRYIKEISKELNFQNFQNMINDIHSEKISFYFGFGCDAFWKIPIYALEIDGSKLIDKNVDIEILSLTVCPENKSIGNSKVCVCSDNTDKEKLKKCLQDSRFIHFSTHCSKDNQIELKENIFFEKNDIPEISPELVYLACCYGIYSKYTAMCSSDRLIHGFVEKGERNFIGSIWPVKDKNSYDIVESFYHSYFEKMSGPSRSLKIALDKDVTSCDEEYKSPVFWANYMSIRVLDFLTVKTSEMKKNPFNSNNEYSQEFIDFMMPQEDVTGLGIANNEFVIILDESVDPIHFEKSCEYDLNKFKIKVEPTPISNEFEIVKSSSDGNTNGTANIMKGKLNEKEKFFALTCAHVYFCSDQIPDLHKQYQKYLKRDYQSSIKICVKNVEYDPKPSWIQFDVKGNVDIALLELNELSDFSGKEILVKEFSEYTLAKNNVTVSKNGITTGVTKGKIEEFWPKRAIDHFSKSGLIRNTSMNQFAILSVENEKQFTDYGDSGSLIIYENHPIAVHHRKYPANGKIYSMASSIIQHVSLKEMIFYDTEKLLNESSTIIQNKN